MPAIETKYLAGEIDFKSIGDGGEFSGYISTFGNVDQGGDMIMPGAFDESIAMHKKRGTMPKMLWQHDPSIPIGIWTDLQIDEKGVKGNGKLLLDIPKGRETYILVKSRAVDGISIGYRTVDADRLPSGVRELKRVNLFEASVVTFPMNIESTITSVKSLDSIRDVERVLRDAGVPNAFAKLVASHGYDEAKALLESQQRDAEVEKELTERGPSLLKSIRQLQEKFNA